MPDRRVERAADWFSVARAVATILDHVQPVATEEIPITEALGRVLVADATSPIDHPPWHNSAMDGYAVRSDDIAGASRHAPAKLRVIETIAAGTFPTRSVGRGEASRIMTGAPVPEGADGVVRVEHTRTGDADSVLVLDDADAGRNVRARGEDMRAGDAVVRAGQRLRPAHIGVLAATGHAGIAVYRRPRIAILSTGDELADLDDFDEVRAGRRIANSNGYALAAAVLATGAATVPLGIARDTLDSLSDRLTGVGDADALLTTAGASVGDHDLVKDALEAMGMRGLFWRVLMRPGSPASFGIIARPGAPDLPVFGLAGNPVSALVTFEILVRPAIRRLAGRTDLFSRTSLVTLGEPMPAAGRLTHFVRAVLEPGAGGNDAMTARLTGPQGSGILTSIAAADALVVIPPGHGRQAAGTRAMAIRLDIGDATQPQPEYDRFLNGDDSNGQE